MTCRLLLIAIAGLTVWLAACGNGETHAPAVIEWTATPSPATAIEFPQYWTQELIRVHKEDTQKYGLAFTCLYSGGGYRWPSDDAAKLGISHVFTDPAAGTGTLAVNGSFVESFHQIGYKGEPVTRAKKVQLPDAICYVPER